MKKYILLLSILFVTQLSFAQVKEVITDIRGQFEVVVQIGSNAYIVVNQYGEVLDIDMHGQAEYYSGFNDYEKGKIKKIGINGFPIFRI